MRLKSGVNSTDIKPQIWWALGCAEMIFRALNRELVVTSLRDGQHQAGSFHYQGLAVDIRTRHLTNQEEIDMFSRLKNVLDFYGYDVLRESDHVHIEYDPKASDHDWLATTS